MTFPHVIIIQDYEVQVIYIFVAVALLCSAFVLWYEGRRDGFDDEKLFDLSFSCFLLCFLLVLGVRSLLVNLMLYNPESALLTVDPLFLYMTLILGVLLIVTHLLTGVWRWSPFRILDICAVTLNLFIFFVAAGMFLVNQTREIMPLLVIMPLFHILFLRFRGYRFKSGMLFSLFLLILAAYVLVFYRKPGYLIFALLLATIGFVNFYRREKKNMMKRNLPLEFIQSIKRLLLQKDKELGREQEALVKEDPYMQVDRAVANSELIDEAILEDNRKELFDMNLNFLKAMRTQIKKALALIKIGKYGVCEVCGMPIDKSRLKAFPEATTCIHCSKERELRA